MDTTWKSYEAMEELIGQTLMDCPRHMQGIALHILKAKGKGVRGRLLLLTAGMGKDSEKTHRLAAAIEILHLATLIHDDIIDEALMRRGSPSLQHLYGKDKAVMYGDYLFAKSFSLLSMEFNRHLTVLARGVEKICSGEIYQQSNRYNTGTSVFQYLKAVSGKTAALFSIAMAAGALEGELEEGLQKTAAKAGYYIGMCFQIIDDCLDFNAKEAKAGKTLKKDIIEGYYTLPILFSLRNDPGNLLAKELGMIRQGSDDITKAVGLIMERKGLEQANDIALKYRWRAERQLDAFVGYPNITEIKAVVASIYDRTH